jgi:hypothetical protein
LDAALPIYIQTRVKSLDAFLLGPHMATMALGALGVISAMLSITGIFADGSLFGQQTAAGTGYPFRAWRQQVENLKILKAALGRAVKLLMIGSAARTASRNAGQPRARFHRFAGVSPRPADPDGHGAAMSILGLVATWIPAQRALSVDAVKPLREEVVHGETRGLNLPASVSSQRKAARHSPNPLRIKLNQA